MDDWISVVAVIGSLGSFVAALFVFWMQRLQNQASEIARLHQLWWSEDMEKYREETYSCIREWEENGRNITPIIQSYQSDDSTFSNEKRAIARVAFFFSDLNAMIDQRLVNKRLAYRIFGEAQFYWFSPFLLSIANELEIRGAANADGEKRVVRWVPEIRALERKFNKLESKRS